MLLDWLFRKQEPVVLAPPQLPAESLRPIDHLAIKRTAYEIQDRQRDYGQPTAMHIGGIVPRLLARFIDEGWTELWFTPDQIWDETQRLAGELHVIVPDLWQDHLLYTFAMQKPLVVRYRPYKRAVETKKEFAHIRQQYYARGEPIPERPTFYKVLDLTAFQRPKPTASRPSRNDVSAVQTVVTEHRRRASRPRRNSHRKAA
jgi:hypothetical protein